MDATRPWRLEGVVQHYAWGSRTAIPELLGVEPDGRPWAELWLGAHPKAPARVLTDEGPVPLDAWIARDPEAVLGPRVAERFGEALPFLLKILAADQPLSIQAHPDGEQARAGFARENAAGIPLDAPHRSYRDASHKPELICALTPFHALNRFREPDEIAARLAALEVPALAAGVEALRRRPDRDGLAELLGGLWGLDAAARRAVGDRAQAMAAEDAGCDPALRWMADLAARHPGDVGVLAPLFLNVVTLEPGEAMFLPAGEMHAYLHGAGVEIMASSDNVLRGGLTPKHVDREELLRTLTFRSGDVEVLSPGPGGSGEARYETPAEEFALARIELEPGAVWTAPDERGVDVLLCAAGDGRIATDTPLELERGDTWIVPASAPGYRLEGIGRDTTVYRATVGGA